jgi:hypothetical protein
MTDLLDEGLDRRLDDAARRWQDQQPPPPAVPIDRLESASPHGIPWRLVAVAVAVVALVGAGGATLLRGGGAATGPSQQPPSSPATHGVPLTDETVPWHRLDASHAEVGHREHGRWVTPFDNIAAAGRVAPQAHPGDVLRFVVTLEAPTRVVLDPCPDYQIHFGRYAFYTWALNCAQVPYRDGRGRPVLPALTEVRFAMRLQVPEVEGRQKMLWTLAGPGAMPGFYRIVRVSPGG